MQLRKRRIESYESTKRKCSPSPSPDSITYHLAATPTTAATTKAVALSNALITLPKMKSTPCNKNGPLYYLCSEVKVIMFHYLDIKSRCRLSQVCRSFRKLIYSFPRWWTWLDLSGVESRMSPLSVHKRILMILHSPHLTSQLRGIDLSYTCVDHEAVAKLCCGCPLLEKLNLSFCHSLSPFSLINLSYASRLSWLSLEGCRKVDSCAITILPNSASHLKYLNLSRLGMLTSLCLLSLLMLPELEELKLDHTSFDDLMPLFSFRHGALSKLHTLSLQHQHSLTDAHIQELTSHFHQLQNITFTLRDFRSVSGPSLALFRQKCPHLKALNLTIEHSEMLQECLPTLKEMDEANVSLDLWRYSHNTDLSNVFQLPNLVSIRLCSPYEISEESLKSLMNHCPRLRRLSLDVQDVSSSGLKSLGDGPKLTWLQLSYAEMTHDCLQYLSLRLNHLKVLHLDYPKKKDPLVDLDVLFKGLTQLECITLHLGDMFHDRELRRIGYHCPKLTKFGLHSQLQYPRTLQGIAKHCRLLRVMELSTPKNHPQCSLMEQALVRLFQECTSIERLYCFGDLLTPRLLRYLPSLPQLHTLYIDLDRWFSMEQLDQMILRCPRLAMLKLGDVTVNSSMYFKYKQMGIQIDSSIFLTDLEPDGW